MLCPVHFPYHILMHFEHVLTEVFFITPPYVNSCSFSWQIFVAKRPITVHQIIMFITVNEFYSCCECVQWRIYIVKFWTRPPWGSKFFQFHAVFGKIWQNRMLAPPPPRGVGAPPRGNPGSATGVYGTKWNFIHIIHLLDRCWYLSVLPSYVVPT